MTQDKINIAIEQQKALLDACLIEQKSALVDVAGQLVARFHRGGRLLLVGTGPFGAIASLIGQCFIHRQTLERPALPAIALTNDPGLATFLATEGQGNQIFSRQLRAVATADDALLILGGKSLDAANQEALHTAQQLGCCTIVIASESAERTGSLPDISISIPSNSEPRLLEGSLSIGNLLCTLVESELFGI